VKVLRIILDERAALLAKSGMDGAFLIAKQRRIERLALTVL